LGIDCAGGSCSAAVVVDRQVVADRCVVMARGQAEALMPMIEAVLAAAGLDITALDLVAVTVGPGSFTGLRIGLATARGLALALSLPLIGASSFEAVADAVADEVGEAPLLVALESKRAELFLQCFTREGPGEPALVSPGAWPSFAPSRPFILAGDGAPRLAAEFAREDFTLAQRYAYSNAAAVARIGAKSWEPGTRLPPPRPLYLRTPDVSLPLTAERMPSP
jgi:tRNA threonylcarbamoyladenosine biosynthesis protein TsaB